MATSVDNRHFGGLEPDPVRLSMARNFKARSDSPAGGCNFQQTQEINYTKKTMIPKGSSEYYCSSDDEKDGDEDDDEKKYYEEAIMKGKNELEQVRIDSRDEGTPDNWIKRDISMLRLTGKHPCNAEPPLNRLMHHGFITPVQLHYVRNHGYVPKASWDDWTVEVTGLVKKPVRFTMDQLVKEFPSREFPVTLVCARNRGKEQNTVKQTLGFDWGAGGVATSVWRGVPLHEVLKRCGIYSKKKGALNVCFEGGEDLPSDHGSKYGTSVSKEVAMDPSRDIILAYMQNGDVLSPDHGFPVRVIIPGCIGERMVKWLKRIVVTSKEYDNRVFPPHVDAELATPEGWWYKPEYTMNEVNINSVITTPCHQEIVPINSWTTQIPYTLKGYAYSGGGKKVIRVEVTMDDGETWEVCKLEQHENANKYGRYWCWCFWSLEVELLLLLTAKEIAVRAWDETLNTQPEKLIWNFMGMMNNCWFRVQSNVCKAQKGEIGIVFEHPTQPGNQSGGWMAKERRIEKLSKTSPFLKKSLSSPFMNTTPTSSPSSPNNSVHGASNVAHLAPITEMAPPRSVALIPREKIPCKLVSKVSISNDVRKLRFALPSEDQVLGLAVGKHIFVCAIVDDKLCMRAYTPSSGVDEVGYFELVVKIYFKGVHPKFPNGGLMSQYLDSVEVGKCIDVKGPLGHIEYRGKGTFLVHGELKFAKKLAMIAGGTGITPIFQVMQAILKDPEDETEMYVVYANRSEDDILLKDELDGWAENYPERVKVWYVVQEAIKEGWKYSVGFVSETILRDHIPNPSPGSTLALSCGPPPMIQFAVKPSLEKMGYDIRDSLLVF